MTIPELALFTIVTGVILHIITTWLDSKWKPQQPVSKDLKIRIKKSPVAATTGDFPFDFVPELAFRTAFIIAYAKPICNIHNKFFLKYNQNISIVNSLSSIKFPLYREFFFYCTE